MSLQTLATELVELCNQGKNFDVMEMMYAPDIVSVEASGEQVAGKRPVIDKSRRWQAGNTVKGEKGGGPFFDGAPDAAGATAGQFAVFYTFDVIPKSTGKPVQLEEVGVYTVKDDQITREQFYYAGTR